MLTLDGERVIGVQPDGTLHLCDPRYDTATPKPPRVFFDSSGACLPDLADPATAGALVAACGPTVDIRCTRRRGYIEWRAALPRGDTIMWWSSGPRATLGEAIAHACIQAGHVPRCAA